MHCIKNASIESITIPASVQSIGNNAFAYAKKINTVIFEEGSQLQSIESYAFASVANLQSIVIPASVQRIGSFAFYNITYLSSITFEEDSQLQSIGTNAFSRLYDSGLRIIIIPITVTEIGKDAFDNTPFLSIKVVATEKPSGWDIEWNGGNEDITWGYVG
jgi:hypothetical protein